jgi:hypothetical protein
MNEKTDMTVTDIINRYLKQIGLEGTKRIMLYKGMDPKHREGMESAIDKAFNEGINPNDSSL